MIKFRVKGDWYKTKEFLKKNQKINIDSVLHKYGEIGVINLRNYTPKRTGLTADSWRYEIQHESGRSSLVFLNDNINKGVNIAILLQYGHGTGWGGYVQGVDYINPALQPIFDTIADSAWKEVTA